MGRKHNSQMISLDMLRAFDGLGRSLNLSETAENLGITRQTVRRHISDLEAIRGGPLFELKKQSYALTPLGKSSLSGARSIFRQAVRWSRGEVSSTGGFQHLEYARYVSANGTIYLCQQHPVSAVSLCGTALVQQALMAWGGSLARIEGSLMVRMRPHLAIYRRSAEGWVCVEIGENSTYAKWFGWTWAKSAVGRLSEDDRAGDEYNRFVAGAYDQIQGEGGVRFDHNFAHLLRENSDDPVPITFQRLLMGCVFPDGAPALAVMTSVTSNVQIDGFSEEDRATVSNDLLKEFDNSLSLPLDSRSGRVDDSIYD